MQVPVPVINRSGMTYTDRVVLVTGASKGIGEGVARVFVDAGSDVVICARGREAGEKLAEELTKKGPGTCHFEQCDVSRPADIERVVDRAAALRDRLDCLVNNAGYHPDHRAIDNFPLDDFMDVLRTDLVSCFVASKRALPHLRKTRGSIVNIGSLVSVMGQECATTYCAAKAGMNGLTKSLAIEESRFGVRVNIVLPGNIMSYGMVDAANNRPDGEDWINWLASHQPSGRIGTNEDVGQLCLFLASDAASYITGAEIVISSGSELGYGVKYPLSWVKD